MRNEQRRPTGRPHACEESATHEGPAAHELPAATHGIFTIHGSAVTCMMVTTIRSGADFGGKIGSIAAHLPRNEPTPSFTPAAPSLPMNSVAATEGNQIRPGLVRNKGAAALRKSTQELLGHWPHL